MVFAQIFAFFSANPGILAAAVLIFCFIYVLSLLFSGPKPGRNPFSAKYVRPPPGKLVTDHKERDKVLKQSECLRYLSANYDCSRRHS